MDGTASELLTSAARSPAAWLLLAGALLALALTVAATRKAIALGLVVIGGLAAVHFSWTPPSAKTSAIESDPGQWLTQATDDAQRAAPVATDAIARLVDDLTLHAGAPPLRDGARRLVDAHLPRVDDFTEWDGPSQGWGTLRLGARRRIGEPGLSFYRHQRANPSNPLRGFVHPKPLDLGNSP